MIRADSGFCRDDLKSWCEESGVQYVLGLASNERLAVQIAPEMKLAKRKAKRTGKPARVFADFRYRTRKSCELHRIRRRRFRLSQAAIFRLICVMGRPFAST